MTTVRLEASTGKVDPPSHVHSDHPDPHTDAELFAGVCRALDVHDYRTAKAGLRALRRQGWSIVPPKSWPFNAPHRAGEVRP